jgi:hypothetical protein
LALTEKGEKADGLARRHKIKSPRRALGLNPAQRDQTV